MAAPLELTHAGAGLFLDGARLKNLGQWAVDLLDSAGQVLCRVALPELVAQANPPALVHPVVTGDVLRNGTTSQARLMSGATTVALLTVGLTGEAGRHLLLPTRALTLGRRVRLSNFQLPYLFTPEAPPGQSLVPPVWVGPQPTVQQALTEGGIVGTLTPPAAGVTRTLFDANGGRFALNPGRDTVIRGAAPLTAGVLSLVVRDERAGAPNSPLDTTLSVTVSDTTGIGVRDVYGEPASYFPAVLDLPDDFTGEVHLLQTPGSALPLGTVTTHVSHDTRTATLITNALPPIPAPPGMPSTLVLSSVGSAGDITDQGDYIRLGADTTPDSGWATAGLATAGAAGFEYSLTNDVPAVFGFRFRGRLPAGRISDVATLGAMWRDSTPGGFSYYANWAGNLGFRNHADNQTFEVPHGYAMGSDIDLAFLYTNDPQGPGGTLQLYKDGVALGGPRTLTAKLKVQPELPFFVNNNGYNTRAGSTGLGVRALDFTVPVPRITQQFTALTSNVVSASVARTLQFDATALDAPSGPYPLKYRLGAPDASAGEDLTVRVGPYVTAANEAYDVVLQDWSSGAPVQVGVYTLTKVLGQNLSLEDAEFGPLVGRWTEVGPREAPIEIAGLRYYCEGIRMQGYTQLQFGYDFAPSALPSTPFGDPMGLDSYLIAHKWVIRDVAGNTLATLQQHDGSPLNQVGRSPVFEGPWDGLNKPLTTPSNRWVPFGTARMGLIWRSKKPDVVPLETRSARLPRYATDVPYAMHTDSSSNGLDWRLAYGVVGSEGQMNGFGNIRAMPFNPTDDQTWTSNDAVGAGDPYKASLYSFNSKRSVGSTWLKYTPFNMQARSPTTGPGGIRDDRQAIAEPVWLYLTNPTGQRWDGTPYLDLALDYLTGYVSDPVHVFENGRPRPLFKGMPARSITMRGHYYGPGEASTPPERAYYAKGGRPYEMYDGYNPWRAKVPQAGAAPNRPIFGTYQIDALHAHQFPHWGSMLFRTPEFAFLGHKFWDQTRLYRNHILNHPQDVGAREAAWAYLHAALAWKTAAKNSERLYSREDVLAFVQLRLETFHDTWCATTPGLFNPPSTFSNENDLFLILVNRFGPGYMDNGVYRQHDFFIGYWLHALAIGERLGFNAALRARSGKLTAVLDWLTAIHRKRITGRLVDGPRLPVGGGYMFTFPASAVANAGGVAANLPQGYADLIPLMGQADTWAYNGPGTQNDSRDGQGLDLLMAGPSQLKYGLGLAGTALDAAEAVAISWRNERKAAEEAKGSDAGSGWFKFLQGSHNPMLPAVQAGDADLDAVTDLALTGLQLSANGEVEDL